jgi:hypothetical protein
MTEPRPTNEAESRQRLQLNRRARRGLVAGYIHELSERHRDREPAEQSMADSQAEAMTS